MSRIRGSSLRSRLIRTFVTLGIVSVVLLAVVNFAIVRGLLGGNSRAQLETLREVHADAVELAIDRLLVRTSVIGLDPAVGDALADLEAGYTEIDTELDDDELAELEAAYEPLVSRYDDAGVERPEVAELLPRSDAGRYVQYEYVASNPADDRSETLDAGDGSDYSAAHAEHHEYLRTLARGIGATDLLLIGGTTRDVVYSVEKHVDLGTDVAAGPYADDGLGIAIEKLAGVGVDEATIADTSFYLPNAAGDEAPVVHAAAPVRAGLEVIGVVVLTLPTGLLTDLVTSGQDWDLLGLGDTGDAYIVGRDRLLRTVPRGYFEDPVEHVERLVDTADSERVGELVEFTGSPVLLQEVDNDVVRDALDGDVSIGSVTNGVGRGTVASAQPLDVGGLGWVIVTEQADSEARDELERFVWSILIVLGGLLVGLVIVSTILAQRVAAPVRPLVRSTGAIADGDHDVEMPDLGRNELGDVGRQLELVAAQLREQEASIEAEEHRIEEMLESTLPPALVERVRNGERELADVVDTATVIAVAVRGVPASTAAEQDALVELTSQMNREMSSLAADHGVEKVRISLERQLFVAGRGDATAGSDRAAAFALAAIERIPAVAAEQGLDVQARAGLSSGLVASGVIGTRQVAFDVWGQPVSAAVELADHASDGGLLLDESAADGLDDGARVETLDDGRYEIAPEPTSAGDE